ncbi:ferritin family protein [Thermococcus sp.]|uniref:ferritin-like domain-containing protein n=1 Tax=Thermococcus sp. TaxID=35749 RepID=UPI002627650C|nr:ferritin family protein [Thermococcus sp.]
MVETESERFSHILSALSGLSERELLSYWIRGEYEEAETYWKLAKRAKELELPEDVIETFVVLAKESREHGDRLREIYVRSYGENPVEVGIPGVEAEALKLEMDTPKDVLEVLARAMETELFAESLYEKLATETGSDSLKSIYLYLAEIERGHYERLKCEFEVCKKIYEKS